MTTGIKNIVDDENDDEEKPSNSSSTSSDLVSHIQQIRSKFKLLTIQLGWNNFSLKDLMDNHAEQEKLSQPTAAANDGEQAATQITASCDW
jgi:hypothetical protein